jgi:hypothetical protein
VQFLQPISDVLFYAVCFGIAIYLLNGGGDGGRKARLPVC